MTLKQRAAEKKNRQKISFNNHRESKKLVRRNKIALM